MNNISIVYTPAGNLRKSADMAVGQVRLERTLIPPPSRAS
jgi:hypothetical protein